MKYIVTNPTVHIFWIKGLSIFFLLFFLSFFFLGKGGGSPQFQLENLPLQLSRMKDRELFELPKNFLLYENSTITKRVTLYSFIDRREWLGKYPVRNFQLRGLALIFNCYSTHPNYLLTRRF